MSLWSLFMCPQYNATQTINYLSLEVLTFRYKKMRKKKQQDDFSILINKSRYFLVSSYFLHRNWYSADTFYCK